MMKECEIHSWFWFLIVIAVFVPMIFFIQQDMSKFSVKNTVVEEYNLSSGDFFVYFEIESNIPSEMVCLANYSIFNDTNSLSLEFNLGTLDPYDLILFNQTFEAFGGNFSFELDPYCRDLE